MTTKHSWFLKKRWQDYREAMIEVCRQGGTTKGRTRQPPDEQTKRRISETLKAKGCAPPWELSPATKPGKTINDSQKEALLRSNLNRLITTETRIKMSEAKKAERNPGWKGGVKTEREQIRNSWLIKAWRWAVFTRDNFMCRQCGLTKKTLHAHHIKEFASSPELRFDVDNGLTLCVECHKQTPTFGGKWKR